jgi:CTP:molybdopterin cytidylyltransferase MocA
MNPAASIKASSDDERRPGLIGGLILAAGAATRFGRQPKLLAALNGRPLLEHAIRAQCEVAALSRVVVVLGAGAGELIAGVDFGRAEPVICTDWERGQAASLRCGLAALTDVQKVIVTLGDEPLITPQVLALFADQPGGARAVYEGRPGHPVVLGPVQLHSLDRLSGDRGARDLLTGPEIECSSLCSSKDVDTPEDLEAIRDEARAIV